MSKVTLYYTTLSPPSRAILTVAEAIGLDIEKKNVDLFKGEHLTPEYTKVNWEKATGSITLSEYTILPDQSTTYSPCNRGQRCNHL